MSGLGSISVVSTPIIPVSEKHPIGSLFEINGVQFHGELDSGEEMDIQITLELAQALGLGTDTAIRSAKVFAGKWPKPHDYTRIWVNFNPPGLPPVRTTATIRAPKGTPFVPLTLIMASGYSVTISREKISYEPAHESGVPYTKPWNAGNWTKTVEHRTPPYLNFYVDGQDMEYPALLDTGSWIATLTSATARMLDITRYSHGPVVVDYGPSQSYMVPLQLDGVILVLPVIISDKYPGNLVPASLFIEKDYSLTFNPNSLEID